MKQIKVYTVEALERRIVKALKKGQVRLSRKILD